MTIFEQYGKVLQEVADACRMAGRDPDDVMLLAVSKTVGVEGVREAYDAGARAFGENRPEPLLEKHAAFPDVEWHFIGNIQSRRIRDIVSCAYMIHSLYQLRHAAKISDEAIRMGKRQKVLVEVNVSGEASKSGITPSDAQDFVEECLSMPGIEVCGLMTMAPQGNLEVARECFADLRRLRDAIRKGLEAIDSEAAESFAQLSMGMTEDWHEAIAEGSTIVRIGRAIFQQ